MNQNLIFLPLLLQVTVTFAVYISLGRAKEAAIKNQEVDLERRGTHDDAWPVSVQKINHNIRNQFETPVLFYVLVIILWLMNAAGIVAQCIAWLFAITRVLHAYEHTGSNFIPRRKRLFQAGVVLLMTLAALTLVAIVFPAN